MGQDVANEDSIDDALLSRDERYLTVIVRLSRATVTASQSEAERVETMRDTADRTQRPVIEFARERDGVRLRNRFWIANAVLLEVDTDKVSLREIAELPGVRWVHENSEVRAIDDDGEITSSGRGESTDADDASTLSGEYTYGLEQINVPDIWEDHDTQGEGVKVAVLDSGIHLNHQDLDLYTEDSDDPTYPGGWAEFDGEGDIIEDSEPHDTTGHGTHVSGTVAGGDASGTHIGVAPDVDLMHGLVLPDDHGTFTQILGGMQWCLEESVDVINMSLGTIGGGHDEIYIEPLQNIQKAGTLVVSSSMNDGEGYTGSPANVYGAGMAIGNSNEDEEVNPTSGGEKIVTADDWSDADSDLIEDWPDEYIVPDVAAPGTDVFSAVPGEDDYGEATGTSMAAPHVAGVAALVLSAGGEIPPEDHWELYEEHAWKPDDWDEEEDAEDAIDGKDTRYGKGIIDAKAVVDAATLESGIEGAVTDATDGSLLEGVVVKRENGGSTTTDDDGEYRIYADAGDHELTVDTFGFAEQSHTVTVSEDEFSTQDISLDRQLDGQSLVAQPAKVEGGEPVETTLETAHAETVSVSLDGDYDEADAELVIDGDESATFDDPVSIDDGFTEVSITVETTADTEGDIELQVTVEDETDAVTIETGSTTVFTTLVEVGLVGHAHLGDVESMLATELPSNHAFTKVSDAADADDYDVVVVQSLATVAPADFVDATNDDQTGVVYLDQRGADSSGIPDFAEIADDEVTDTGEDARGTGDEPTPIFYEPTLDHPIIDDFDVGEDVLIHDGEYGDITAFVSEGYEVIATVDDEGEDGDGDGNGDEQEFPALAVNDETRTVLASSLGYTEYVGEEQYTEAADTILSAAVEYAAKPPTVPFSVDLTDVTDVDPGGIATIQIEGSALEELTIHNLWTDWEEDGVGTEGATDVIDKIADEGTFTFEWDEPTEAVNPSLAVDLDEDYEGGTFRMTVAASGVGESFEGTLDLTLVEDD